MTGSVVIFSAAISACGKGGQWHKSLSLLDDTHIASLTATVFSFIAASSACEEDGQWQRSLLLLYEAQGGRDLMHDQFQHSHPGVWEVWPVEAAIVVA